MIKGNRRIRYAIMVFLTLCALLGCLLVRPYLEQTTDRTD